MHIELSKDERRILEMVVGNMSTSEIAFALDVEQPVVKAAIESIFEKLGARDARSAAEIAGKLELVKLKL